MTDTLRDRLTALCDAKEAAFYNANWKDWTGRRTGPSTDVSVYELRKLLWETRND